MNCLERALHFPHSLVLACVTTVCTVVSTPYTALAAITTPAPQVVYLAVDADDDDGNDVSDGAQAQKIPSNDLANIAGIVGVSTLSQARACQLTRLPKALRLVINASVVRCGKSGNPGSNTSPGGNASEGAPKLQATAPGRHRARINGVTLDVRALQILALDDSQNAVSFTSSHASVQRTPPARSLCEHGRAASHCDRSSGDPDALRYVVVGNEADLPTHVRIASQTQYGALLDTLRQVALISVPCPTGTAAGLECRTTPPIRVVADATDRDHPLAKDRSIIGQLAGGLVIRAGKVAQQIRIGGPRITPWGPIRRYRAHLDITIFRNYRGGAASLHPNEREAKQIALRQIDAANALWQQCGISFGSTNEEQNMPVRVIDPPQPNLIAVGCDLGAPASGGAIRWSVDGAQMQVSTEPSNTPEQVARAMANVMRKANLQVTLWRNPMIRPGALPVVDLVVHRKNGQQTVITTPNNAPASSDPSLPVCVPTINFALGLPHFVNADSIAGTVQERALLHAVGPSATSSLRLVLIAAFASGGRIGETFLGENPSRQTILNNLVLIDRVGAIASSAAHTLAHELGHVLLRTPGHPDDYEQNTSTLLMHSDAADASAFGPRRISVSECIRAIRQSTSPRERALLTPEKWIPLAKPARSHEL